MTILRVRKPRRSAGRSERIPVATYRLQFNAGFGFLDAAAIGEYVAELGISDVYASPLFAAGPGSAHGYDACDFRKINPELGGKRGWERWGRRLRRLGLGLVLDMAPNHMRADICNPWWRDVLEKGRASKYAAFFDIDWDAAELKRKVLLPVLEDEYWKVLESGKLTVAQEKDKFSIAYYDLRFPVARSSSARKGLRRIQELPEGAIRARALDHLLQKQHYRLAWWRTAPEIINYRRFFDITDLVCLRAELPQVFEATHHLIRRMAGSAVVSGLRVDHPDGLWDPKRYFHRLQTLLRGETARKTFWVVAEKILSPGEELPREWPVEGTTGYDFLNQLNGIFVDSGREEAFDRVYENFVGSEETFDQVLYSSRRRALLSDFARPLRCLVSMAESIAGATRYGRDITRRHWKETLIGFLSAFPVYRTYIDARSKRPSAQDRRAIDAAIRRCQAFEPLAAGPALRFLRQQLLLHLPEDLDRKGRARNRRFAMRLQQLSAPLAAKGLEDTACYRFNRLVSLNEVGGNPGRFGQAPSEFHAFNRRRAKRWPHTLLATATHDTKRGEDARARINVLSEMPEEWSRALARWRRWNADKKTLLSGQLMPDANDEYLFYQTLIGARPFEGEGAPSFVPRMTAYMSKAIREAKRHTSWTDQNVAYEAATRSFVEAVLKPGKANPFLADFIRFEKPILFQGMINSLAQVLLKIASPGVPDFYQGAELWDLSLVDPDNRRPVDYEIRKRMLADLKERSQTTPLPGLCQRLLDTFETGEIKLFTTWRALQLRREKRELFENGRYMPVAVKGMRKENVCAFVRASGPEQIIAVVPRLVGQLCRRKMKSPLGKQLWEDTLLCWPGLVGGRTYRDQFTGQALAAQRQGRHVGIRMADALKHFPVALLVSE